MAKALRELANKYVHADEAGQYIVNVYQGFMTAEMFRAVSDVSLEESMGRGYHKTLVDLRNMAAVPRENQEWINNNWFPRATQGGIKAMAFLVPTNVFAQTAMQRANKGVDEEGAITLAYFDDIGAAQKWLAEQ